MEKEIQSNEFDESEQQSTTKECEYNFNVR